MSLIKRLITGYPARRLIANRFINNAKFFQASFNNFAEYFNDRIRVTCALIVKFNLVSIGCGLS